MFQLLGRHLQERQARLAVLLPLARRGKPLVVIHHVIGQRPQGHQLAHGDGKALIFQAGKIVVQPNGLGHVARQVPGARHDGAHHGMVGAVVGVLGLGEGAVLARQRLGHGAGVGLYALLTAMGLSLLLTRTPWLFELIRYAGALFLALLGLQALLPQKPKAEATNQHATSRRRGALEGLAVAFLNPQLAIFFLALFSQFVQQQTSWAQGGLLLLTAGGIDALWYLLVAGIFSHGRLLPWLTRHQRQLQRLSGLLLLAIALRVLWAG